MFFKITEMYIAVCNGRANRYRRRIDYMSDPIDQVVVSMQAFDFGVGLLF